MHRDPLLHVAHQGTRILPLQHQRANLAHRLQQLPLLFRSERQLRTLVPETGVLFRSVPLHQLYKVARDRQAAPR